MNYQKLLFLVISILFFSTAYAEDESVTFSRDLIRYLDLENKVTESQIAELAKAKVRAEDPALTKEQRTAAYKDLFTFMFRIMGATPPDALVERFTQTAVSWTCRGQSPKTRTAFAKPAELANVKKQGSGKIPVILIPDSGMDGDVFQNFINRNKPNYTLFAVTLPGFGGSAPLANAEHRDYASLRLWKNAEAAILKLIKTENLKSPVLIGHQAGGYLALRMALNHPDLIKAAIVLNGLLYAPVMSPQFPNGKLTLEARHQMAQLFMPIELFPRPDQDCFTEYWKTIGGTMSTNPQQNLLLAQNGGKSDAHQVWDHYAELLTTDLSHEIDQLKVPTLVVPSITDPKESANNIALNQWKGIQSKWIKVVPMNNAGTFALDDKPQELDQLIRDFVTD